MLLLCLCALSGAYSLLLIATLPPASLFLLSLIIGSCCLPLALFRPVAFYLIGFGVMGIASSEHKSDQLDPALQGESIAFTARIEGFPIRHADSIRLVVRPLRRDDLPRQIRLTWFQPNLTPSIGESWRLHIRVKRPRGFANPGGFDFAGWLFRQHIGATGYVVDSAGNYLIHGESPGVIDSLRKRFVDRVAQDLPNDDASAVLIAIGVGARHRIAPEQWDLYALTGTSHLMAISGLHIGLAAACAYFLCWAVLAPWCSRRNLRDIAIGSAVLAAVAYATLSGFAVPARRAFLMTAFAGVLLLFRRRVRPALLLGSAGLAVFLLDPIAILSPGFKLSFSAVAILIYVAGQHNYLPRIGQSGWTVKALSGVARLTQLQLALLTGLFPLTILLFGRFAIVAPVINMLVLPIFNFVTVPLTLAGAVFDGPFDVVGQKCLAWAHRSISGILWLVNIAGELSFSSLQTRHLDLVFSGVAFVPAMFALLPPGWPGRKLSLIAIAAVLTYRPDSPPASCIDYHVLDVGQGLAVVVQTSQHALLFDTGPSFRSVSDTAELVVLPFLQGRAIDRLDKLIISHGDLDHAGGAQSIVTGMAVEEVLVGERLPQLGRMQTRCKAGDRWRWDSVDFTILHPRQNTLWKRNNSSCVLLVETGPFSLLLTGDIESSPEKLLVHRNAVGGNDVVVVPHHGSRTSSSRSFVEVTGPGLAIVSAGFQNRWNLPRPEIMARWEASGAEVLNTAITGAVSQRICRDRGPGPARLQRFEAQNYWDDGPPGRP